jgi:hypothetical protein
MPCCKNTAKETNSYLASQEIPRLLRKPNVHHRIYKSPPPAVPVLSQLNPLAPFQVNVSLPLRYHSDIRAEGLRKTTNNLCEDSFSSSRCWGDTHPAYEKAGTTTLRGQDTLNGTKLVHARAHDRLHFENDIFYGMRVPV